MNHYLINKNADEKGRNEIHKTNICSHLPDPKNRENLGWFSSDEDALKHAKAMVILMQMDAIIVAKKYIMIEEENNMNKNQHITPHPDGGWQVKGARISKATVRTDTQYEAIAIGREIARNQHSELVIHGTDGRIRAKDSYGNDPFPPKG